MSTDTITVTISGYGTYSAPSNCVDAMMQRHLPASPVQLREKVQEMTGLETGFNDVFDVSTFLVILADFYDAELSNALGLPSNKAN